MTTILLASYGICWIVAFRRVLRAWIKDFSPLDTSDLAMGMLMGVVFATLGAPFIAAYRALEGISGDVDPDTIARRFAGTDPQEKRRRKQAERRRLQEEIDRLDRELGLVP